MPETRHSSTRSDASRQADHASLARLSETLVPALAAKLSASGLGELEIHEGDWRIRLRRPSQPGPVPRRAERGRPSAPARPGARPVATASAVGVVKPVAQVGARVRAGDRIATVDLLGIPQDVVAPMDGTVVEVFVAAGQAVEYGEQIAAIEAPTPLRDEDDDDGPEVAS
jgi:biotin carboxyl carrier protein